MRIRTPLLLLACAGVVAPCALAEGPHYLVAGQDAVQKYDLDGNYLGDLIAPGGDLSGVSQFVLSPDGSKLYAGTFGAASNVSIFDAQTGAYMGNLDDGGPLAAPSVISWSHTGSLLVSDFGGGEVYEYNPDTNERIGTFFDSTLLINPHEVIAMSDGYLVSDYGSNRVFEFNQDGAFVRTVLSPAANGIARPLDMILSDDESTLYVSNNASGRVTVYDMATGALTGPFGSGSLTYPEGLAWAPDGSMVVANAGGGNLVRFDVTTGAVLDTFEIIPGTTQGATDVLFVVPAPGGAAALLLAGPWIARRRRR
ncbi:MAG: hypothetical protein DHS20C14_19620 [Phycisphaeraceae bacterium]|nr:MAG: hypothetical protein DHS20C14_19620 [Phycisphaeraceae bacterium]